MLSSLGRYGRHLGRLWHIAEDVSVLRHGDGGVHLLERALTGRPVLPVVRAIENDPSIGPAWVQLVTEPEEAIATDIARRIVDVGGISGAAEVMLKLLGARRMLLIVVGRWPDLGGHFSGTTIDR